MKEYEYEGKTVVIDKGIPYWKNENGKVRMTHDEQVAFRIWKEENVYAKRTKEIINSSPYARKINRGILEEKMKNAQERDKAEREKEYVRSKNKKEKSVEEEWKPPFAYIEDGKAIEIWGKLKGYIPITDNSMYVDVEDINGNNHRLLIRNVAKIYAMLKRLFPRLVNTYIDKSKVYEYMKEAVATDKTLLWRAVKSEFARPFIKSYQELPKYPLLFAVLTKQFVKYKNTDFMKTETFEEIRSMFKDISTEDYDGISAGKIVFKMNEIGTMGAPEIVMDFGKVGDSSLKIYSKLKILKCSNQLSFVGSTLYENNYSMSFDIKIRHTGDLSKIVNDMKEIVAAADNFDYLIEEAKNVKMDIDTMNLICKYLIKQNKMSQRTYKKVIDYWYNDEITQVPNTAYGLAMVFSYIATHDNKKPGVSWNMSGAAGEIIVMAPTWKEYIREIKELLQIRGKHLIKVSQSD